MQRPPCLINFKKRKGLPADFQVPTAQNNQYTNVVYFGVTYFIFLLKKKRICSVLRKRQQVQNQVTVLSAH